MREKNKNRTPLLLRLLLYLVLPYDEMHNLTGDFEELYKSSRKTKGAVAAVLAIIWQIIISSPGFLKDKLYWGGVMFKNYLLATFRNIKSQKGYSFINITGLAIGFTCSMLIILYIQYEFSYDKHFKDVPNIYRVCSETTFSFHGKNKGTATPAPLGREIKSQFPEIISTATFVADNNVLIEHGNNKFIEDKFYFSEPSIFDVFSLSLIEGNPETVLSDPYSIVLSESMASKYFGSKYPLGETISVDGETDFIVTGIIEDIPDNSHFNINFIVPLKSTEVLYNDDLSSWFGFGFYTYFKIRSDTDTNLLETKIRNLSSLSAMPGKEPVFKYFIQPISDIHLYSDLRGELDANNDIKTIYLFGLIAVLILIIAGINYINLSTSRSVYRAKEIGIRKVVGANKSQIVKQFLSESFVLAFLAAIISILIIIIVLPYFNTLIDRNLQLKLLYNTTFLFPLFAFVLLIGIGAGIYPSLVMSSFKPVSVLNGKAGSITKGGILRNIFVISQFSISIVLIITTLIINEQLSFIKNKDVGYTREQILTIPIRDRSINNNIEAIKSELVLNSEIADASFSEYLPNNIQSLIPVRSVNDPNSEPIPFYRALIDYNFTDFFNIEMLDGRNFSNSFPSDSINACLVNETAVKALNFDSPIGKEFYLPSNKGLLTKVEIIGVMKDFHMHALHQKIEPLYCILGKPRNYSVLSIKILPGDLSSSIDYIKQTFVRHSTKYPFEYNFFDEIFNRVYKREQKEEVIFSLFASLAIFVACLGLFGLISFIAVRRTKEIGIRKVLGASVPRILGMLSKDFIKLILIANVIAWPIAYYLMNNWLNNFAYRIELGITIFVISGLIALIIAGITISLQAARAAIVNPVDSLRYE